MLMLFIHVMMWCLGAAVATYYAVLAFKRKWLFAGILDVAIAFVDVAMMIGTIVNYFIH